MPRFVLNVDGSMEFEGQLELDGDTQYYFVLHDPYSYYKEIRTCAPCPEVLTIGEIDNNLNSYKFTLTEPWQRFWFALFTRAAYNRMPEELNEAELKYMVQRWSKLTWTREAFTNGNGDGTNHNYINGTCPDKPDMAMDKIRFTGGASVTGIEKVNSTGKGVLEVRTFDGNASPPDPRTIDMDIDPRVFFATIIQADGRVTRFPMLDGSMAPTPLLRNDVPVPIISTVPVYYPTQFLKKLPLGSTKPNPYILSL